MAGIQGAFSTNWKTGPAGSYWNHRGRETRNPAAKTRLAQSLISLVLDEGRKNRTRSPARGTHRMSESR